MDTRPISVGILETQQLFLEYLTEHFERAAFEVVSCCATVEDFIARIHQRPPDVALVALRLERSDSTGVTEGFRVLELLHDFFPHVRPLVLSDCREAEVEERCFRAGASGYLCKLTVGSAEVLEAVKRVAGGERLMAFQVAPYNSEAEDVSGRGVLQRLTQREREVLGYVAEGSDNLKIAACLNITERTVKSHITSLYRKLGVENRTQMAVLACQLGVVRPMAVSPVRAPAPATPSGLLSSTQ